MKDITVDDQDHAMWLLCSQVHDAMARIRERDLNRSGITRIQSAVLFIVKNMKGPATPAEISRRLLRKPHSVSELLRRMEKEGLIKRAKDLKRKNQIRISLTKKGERINRKARNLGAIHEIVCSLSEEEQDNMKAYLTKLRTNSIKELGIDYELPFP